MKKDLIILIFLMILAVILTTAWDSTDIWRYHNQDSTSTTMDTAYPLPTDEQPEPTRRSRITATGEPYVLPPTPIVYPTRTKRPHPTPVP